MSETFDPSTVTTEHRQLAKELMAIAMPPFEKFLDHGISLKSECEKAGELTEEKARLFDLYAHALVSARPEYESSIENLICSQCSPEEVKLLLDFYASPTYKLVTRMLTLSATVNNIGTVWQTKVLERCPGTWQMIIENVGKWQEKNTPEGSMVELPTHRMQAEEAPETGWTPIDVGLSDEEKAALGVGEPPSAA